MAPAEAGWLLGLPLGVAEIEGRSLAARRVVFAATPEGYRQPRKDPVGDRLRVLAVFSVPAGQSLLDLRRERKGLADLVAGMVGGGTSRALDLRVLQYGATPKRLQDALAEGEGWDVVHFSGHGAAGRLLLEDDAGRAHEVPTADLVAWLHDARHRLKLVSLAACSSAAFTVAETLQAMDVEAPDVAEQAEAASASHALAVEVLRETQATVVAMRYPVVDEFAIAFDLALFEGLWDKHLDAPSAVGWALSRAARFPPTPGAPALSAFTPAVFGPASPPLRLVPPPAASGTKPDTRMKYFEPEPPRFVGRVAVLTRANAVLAPGSGRSGVHFHGMAGAGKTACALELAYGQRANFQHLVWCKAPPEWAEMNAVKDALGVLVRRLDLALGVALADDSADPDRLAALTEAMEQRSVLVVIDNAESLLSAAGTWRDPTWERVVDALVAHRGRGRLVLTSRRPPATVPAGMEVSTLHALSRDEAVLLARQLPNLSRLLGDQPAPTRQSPQVVRAVLEATGGHPKLMDLADAQAGTGQLQAMLDRAGEVWSAAGVDPARFLTATTDAGPDAVTSYVDLLRAWTAQALATLDEAALLLAQLLARALPEDGTARCWRRTGPTCGATSAAPTRRRTNGPS